MPIQIGKVARDVFWSLLVLLALVPKDSSYFFPWADHSDLRFQVIGESLEIVALVIVFWVFRITIKVGSSSQPLTATFRSRILFAGFVATFLLVLFWRDFFPNDQFDLWAGSGDFLYAPLGGMGILAISYVSTPKHQEPNNEEEKTSGLTV